MRRFCWTGVVLVAWLLVGSGSRMLAQAGGQGGAAGAGRGGGGQMVQGTVTAATADKVTIKTDAGDSYSVTVTANTRVMKDRQPIKLTDVKVGDGLMAMGAVDAAAKTVAAMMVMDVDAATVQKAKDDMGKTYITGKITAIDADNLKLTVLRTDNATQVIAVDEGTSFQRGARGIAVPSMMGGGMGGGRGMGAGGGGMGGGAAGGGAGRNGGAGAGGGAGAQAGMGNGAGGGGTPAEAITLADVKVGDTVVATGALKGGVFVPVKIGVTDPTAAGAGRRRGAAAGEGTTTVPGVPPTSIPTAPATLPPQ